MIPGCWRLWGRGRRGASEFLCRLSHQAYWLVVPCAGSYLKPLSFSSEGIPNEEYLHSRRFLHVWGYVCVPLELSVHTCLLFRAYQWGRSFPGSAFCSSDQTCLCGAVYRQEQPLVTLPPPGGAEGQGKHLERYVMTVFWLPSWAEGLHITGKWTKRKDDKGVQRKLSLLDQIISLFCKFHLPGSQVIHSWQNFPSSTTKNETTVSPRIRKMSTKP